MPILTHEERLGALIGGKYRLESILGRGGMGAVFAARHEWTGRRVAVKLLNHELAALPEMGERFLREARTAAELKHPNVVDVLDMGRDDDGSVYLVLELLDGTSLSTLLDSGPLSVERAFSTLVPVMRALAQAHRRGIVHRDLKPDNIFIAEDAEGNLTPKLLDFGIAKIIEEQATSVTRTGMVLGTPDYMSPEQARGSEIGPAADIWSMGVVWFECLSGTLPFIGKNPQSLLIAIATTPAPRIGSVAPALDSAVAAVIDRALESDLNNRWLDMNAFIAATLDARDQLLRGRGSSALHAVVPADRSTHDHDMVGESATIATGPIDAPALPLVSKRIADESATRRTRMSWVRGDAVAAPAGRTRYLVALGSLAVLALGALAARSFMHRAAGSPVPSASARANASPPSPSAPTVAASTAMAAVAPPAAPQPVPPATDPAAATAPDTQPLERSPHPATTRTNAVHNAPTTTRTTPVATQTSAPATNAPQPAPGSRANTSDDTTTAHEPATAPATAPAQNRPAAASLDSPAHGTPAPERPHPARAQTPAADPTPRHPANAPITDYEKNT